jgi:hypothetical protein
MIRFGPSHIYIHIQFYLSSVGYINIFQERQGMGEDTMKNVEGEEVGGR